MSGRNLPTFMGSRTNCDWLCAVASESCTNGTLIARFSGKEICGRRRAKVKVEVLYVAECPSHPVAVRLVKDILLAEGLVEKVQEVPVKDERMAEIGRASCRERV